MSGMLSHLFMLWQHVDFLPLFQAHQHCPAVPCTQVAQCAGQLACGEALCGVALAAQLSALGARPHPSPAWLDLLLLRC